MRVLIPLALSFLFLNSGVASVIYPHPETHAHGKEKRGEDMENLWCGETR